MTKSNDKIVPDAESRYYGAFSNILPGTYKVVLSDSLDRILSTNYVTMIDLEEADQNPTLTADES